MNQRELYRHIIDGCDEALRDAFLRRMEMALKVAESKLESGSGIFDPQREEEVVSNVSSDLPPEIGLKAQSLWRTLMRMSRSRQYNYFVTHDRSIRLAHEADILPAPVEGPVLCAQNDAQIAASTLGMEVTPCSSPVEALEGLENGQCSWAAVVMDEFYDSDWLFGMIFDRKIYLNSVVLAEGGKHVFLLSQNLYDLPENDMVSIAFSARIDQHGSLAQILEIFADLKINLEYLRFKTQNIDDDTKQKRVIIFANYAAKLSSDAMRSAMLQLEKEAPFFRVMGYRKWVD